MPNPRQLLGLAQIPIDRPARWAYTEQVSEIHINGRNAGHRTRENVMTVKSRSPEDHTSKAADHIRTAFVWNKTPFPDLSGCGSDREKWYALYDFLQAYTRPSKSKSEQ